MKFIHLTDPHLTAAGELFDINVCDRLRQAIVSINDRHADAEMVMVTGDIAHWGEPGAYDFATEIFGALKMPWYPLAGNHDEKPAYFEGMPNALKDDAGRTCFKIDTSAGSFLALDSTVDGTHAGEIDEEQLTWLDQQLGATEEPAFLFLHHHPLKIGLAAMDRIWLKNNDALGAILDRYPGRVRHLFFGHMHRTLHGSWRGTPFSTVKSTAHQVAPVFDPDAPLISSREMPAYAVVLVDDDSVCIHDISYLETDKEFSYDRNSGRP